MPCAIVIFAFLGIYLIVRGWRGVSVPVGPRCARCDYDLQGVEGTAITRCSECGADLRGAGAVRRERLIASRRQVAVGILVIALPWLAILCLMAVRYVGPNGARLRSNQSLIAATQNQPREDWAWYELVQRIKSGRLTGAEIPGAVDALAKHWEQTPPIAGLIRSSPWAGMSIPAIIKGVMLPCARVLPGRILSGIRDFSTSLECYPGRFRRWIWSCGPIFRRRKN
jgi:hypothetical protein